MKNSKLIASILVMVQRIQTKYYILQEDIDKNKKELTTQALININNMLKEVYDSL